MTTAADWQTRVGDVWAAAWRQTDRSFGDLSRHLDAAILAAVPTDGVVLDIGCGAGATSLSLAEARPGLCVTGVDLSAALIDVARHRAVTAGVGDRAVFETEAVDRLPANRIYDALVSRHGVMFFTDPVAGFAHLHTLARPGAPLVFSCFGPRAANRFATLADDLLGRAPPPDDRAPGPFAFADVDHVADVLTRAGWRPEGAAAIEFAYRAGEGADPVADAVRFLSRIGPVASALREAHGHDRAALEDDLALLLEPYRHGEAVDLPARAWIWRATAVSPRSPAPTCDQPVLPTP